MENVKRVTKKDLFGELRVLAEDAGREDLVEFCNKEVEKLANRKVSQTKNQKENEGIMETIVEVFERLDAPVTVTEFAKADERMAEYSNQKLSALFKKLVDAGKLVKETDKKKSYFKLAD
jgi:hypothetical protein